MQPHLETRRKLFCALSAVECSSIRPVPAGIQNASPWSISPMVCPCPFILVGSYPNVTCVAAMRCDTHRTLPTIRISGASLSALAYRFCLLSAPVALRHKLLPPQKCLYWVPGREGKKDSLRLSCIAPRGAIVDSRASLVLNHSKHGVKLYCALQFTTVQAIASRNPAIAVERLGGGLYLVVWSCGGPRGGALNKAPKRGSPNSSSSNLYRVREEAVWRAARVLHSRYPCPSSWSHESQETGALLRWLAGGRQAARQAGCETLGPKISGYGADNL